jgi:thiamine-phosphate pyrophosphorylase
MLLCAITERRLLAEPEHRRRESLLALVRQWARGGVDYIQIREKDLAPGDLLSLARPLVAAVREEQSGNPSLCTKVLLNGPPEIAVEAEADGVHLTGNAKAGAAAAAREIFARAGRGAIVSCSCHTAEEAAQAGAASLLLFAPVYQKSFSPEEVKPGQGLAALTEACRAAQGTPVLALGGITTHNAHACIRAGAKGIAAIRLFLTNDWQELRRPDL